jgi:hypothetical protein
MPDELTLNSLNKDASGVKDELFYPLKLGNIWESELAWLSIEHCEIYDSVNFIRAR